jgi:hypothetical protein
VTEPGGFAQGNHGRGCRGALVRDPTYGVFWATNPNVTAKAVLVECENVQGEVPAVQRQTGRRANRPRHECRLPKRSSLGRRRKPANLMPAAIPLRLPSQFYPSKKAGRRASCAASHLHRAMKRVGAFGRIIDHTAAKMRRGYYLNLPQKEREI